MTTAIQSNVGQYVYAFVRSDDVGALLADAPAGMGEASLSQVSTHGITAITSPTSEIRLRPQRKYLAAHQGVVEWIASQWCMLPVAFGLIADGPDSVAKLIERNEGTLRDQLDRVDGRVEMSLLLRLTVDNVFEYFAARYDELRQASLRIAEGLASRDEQIEIGRQFEAILQAERESHAQRVREGLQDIAFEMEEQTPRGELEMLRAAFLVRREDVDRFSESIHAIAREYTDEFTFQFNGPSAPYSFVKMSLSFE